MADTTQDVSREREELAKWHDRQAKFRKNTDADTAAMHARTAAALRAPHGLPGEEELVLLMRQNLSVDVSNYGLSADIEGIEDAARAILSAAAATSAPTPAPVSGERERCVVCGEPRLLVCGECVKAQYADALRTPAMPGGVDSLRSKPDFHSDPVEQLAFELAFELEEADLKPDDLVTVNREKLRAIAKRILYRLTASREDVK